ncbi:MAG: glycosyltransferase family 2 protein [Candidatus Omnitrophica bacterium]|nr:glycosyltransferase family 2 protein [Candidatus Omnitrophota bacterium]MDE2221928.1 glycosyltransferase family 2 protein [Candidatus Omnitrophota bacterium]
MKSVIKEFHSRRSLYCLIIGVLNEGGRFTRQLKQLANLSYGVDIIIADGGSTDGATDPERLAGLVQSLVKDESGRGLSAQYQSAISYALSKGYEGLILVDGNGKDGMEAIPRFIAELYRGIDLVQGSRFLPGGSCRHTPLLRLAGIRMVFSPLMSLASGFAYTDAINGFKGVSRRLLLHQDFKPLRRTLSRGYRLQYYINYRAPRLGRVMEIPVAREYPAGAKKITKIRGLRSHGSILLELCRVCLGFYN